MDHADAVPIAELLNERRYLLNIAYWMLGSTGEAESVVDESYRRWYGLSSAARRQITAPRPWLAKTVGGICLDRLPDRGAAGRRRSVRTQAQDAEGPKQRLEEEVTWVLLNALDSLSPAERAAFVLKNAGMPPMQSPTSWDAPSRSAPNSPTGRASTCGCSAHVPRRRNSTMPSPAPSAKPV